MAELQTQALEGDSLQQADHMEEECGWGTLIALHSDYSDVELRADEETLGRGERCTVRLQNNAHLSNVHCALVRDPASGLVQVRDLSTNGTFVNAKRIGKGNCMLISPMDELSLLMPNQKADGPGQHYHMRHVLGTGNFASVRLAVHKTSGEHVAIKCIEKKKMPAGSSRAEAVRDEMNILERVSHPHIIRIHAHYETSTTLYLVLELVSGGELFDYMVQKAPDGLPENSARDVFGQIADAVAYLHGQGISHRDLKPENILLKHEPPSRTGPFFVKLSDFGLSRLVGEGSFMTTMCGTPTYLAPEVLCAPLSKTGESAEGYNLKVDVWSMGVVFFILVCGQHPFGDDANVLKRIAAADYSLAHPAWRQVAPSAVSLLRSMLVPQPAQRLSASEVLAHPWLRGASVVPPASASPAPVHAVPVVAVAAAAVNANVVPSQAHGHAHAVAATPTSPVQSPGHTPVLAMSNSAIDNTPAFAVPEPAFKKTKPEGAHAPAVAEANGKAKKTEEGKADAKIVCKYGVACWRKNPQHFEEFAHPWLNKKK